MLAGSNRRFNSGACVFVSYSSDIHSIQFKLSGTLGVVLILRTIQEPRNTGKLRAEKPLCWPADRGPTQIETSQLNFECACRACGTLVP